MAYPHAPIKMDMSMELHTVIHTKHGNSKDHILKLLANIYRQKQAGQVLKNYLAIKLQEINFEQSLTSNCVFYPVDVIFSSWDHQATADQQYHRIAEHKVFQ
jgi:hypothetical protein